MRREGVLHPLQPEAADGHVACNVQKTWRKEFLVKVMSRGKISWPWGNARCMGDLKLDRAILIKSMTEKEFDAQFDKHDLRCELEAENGEVRGQVGDPPQSDLQGRKGGEGQAELGQDRAPRLAKTALWSATAADNSIRGAAEPRRRRHQRFHSVEMHGGKGGVAGQVASPSPSRRGSTRAAPAFRAVSGRGCQAEGGSGAASVMTTALILLVSGVLIGAGISLVWRDARAKRRRAFVSERDARRRARARGRDHHLLRRLGAGAPNLRCGREPISSARPPLPQPQAHALALPAAEPKPSRPLASRTR